MNIIVRKWGKGPFFKGLQAVFGVREKFKNEAELKIERIDREDGSVVFDVMTAAIHQRYTFSEF